MARRFLSVPVVMLLLCLTACAGSAGPAAVGQLATSSPSASASPSPSSSPTPQDSSYKQSEWLAYFPLSHQGERCVSSLEEPYHGYIFTFTRSMVSSSVHADQYGLHISAGVTVTVALRGSGHAVTTDRWTTHYELDNQHLLDVPLVLGDAYPGQEYSWSSALDLPTVPQIQAGEALESHMTVTLDTDRTAGASELRRIFGTSKPKLATIVTTTGLHTSTTLHAGGHTFHDVIGVKIVITSMTPTKRMRDAHAGAKLLKSLNVPMTMYFAKGKGEVVEKGGNLDGRSLVLQSCKRGSSKGSGGGTTSQAGQTVGYVTSPAQ